MVCHAASWAALWNHRESERERFFQPTVDLIDQAVQYGVRRFILTSTIAAGTPVPVGAVLQQAPPGQHTGLWPHMDFLVDVERHMEAQSGGQTQMVSLRLGHFVGAGNLMGLIPALVPRLRTHLVPWLDGGRRRLPLIADDDIGEAFACAVEATSLAPFERINVCGDEFPTMQELVRFIVEVEGLSAPHYSVPYPLAYAFGWLMERAPWLYGGEPFLTRAIVHLAENWVASGTEAETKLGYRPTKNWRVAVRQHLSALRSGRGAEARRSRLV